MGRLFIVSIAAMTSFMTMVQLIALTLTTTKSPASQASTPQIVKSLPAKSETTKTIKAVSRKSARHHTRRHKSAQAANASHRQG